MFSCQPSGPRIYDVYYFPTEDLINAKLIKNIKLAGLDAKIINAIAQFYATSYAYTPCPSISEALNLFKRINNHDSTLKPFKEVLIQILKEISKEEHEKMRKEFDKKKCVIL